MPKPLPLSFFRRPADTVAPELIGCVLEVAVPRRLAASTPRPLRAYITEVEAYLGTTDPASHVWKGRRTTSVLHLYSPPGTWYVYKSHGLHWCANLTAKGKDDGHAVLLRGVIAADEETLKVAQRRRGAVAQKDLTNGPGKLTQALGIDIGLNGVRMAGSVAEVFEGHAFLNTQYTTRVTPRIGLTRAVDWPMRWVVR